MMDYETWKKAFDAWESASAQFMDVWIRSPLVLGPSGNMLTAAMKMKTATDKATARWWGAIGLPTKRDQERTLHTLNRLESKLLDLEERLIEVSRPVAATPAGTPPANPPAP